MKLVTATLLNSFRWYLHSQPEGPEDEIIEREDFLRLLRREPMSENQVSNAILAGRQLEKDVTDYALAPYDYAPKAVEIIGSMCRDGMWQQSVKRVLDGEFLLYGRLDHMRANRIIDIKYSDFYDVGKFLHSAQHRLYLWCLEQEGINEFKYVITDRWRSSVWAEDYYWRPEIENELRGQVNDLMAYLSQDSEAKELFEKHWEALK